MTGEFSTETVASEIGFDEALNREGRSFNGDS